MGVCVLIQDVQTEAGGACFKVPGRMWKAAVYSSPPASSIDLRLRLDPSRVSSAPMTLLHMRIPASACMWPAADGAFLRMNAIGL